MLRPLSSLCVVFTLLIVISIIVSAADVDGEVKELTLNGDNLLHNEESEHAVEKQDQAADSDVEHQREDGDAEHLKSEHQIDDDVNASIDSQDTGNESHPHDSDPQLQQAGHEDDEALWADDHHYNIDGHSDVDIDQHVPQSLNDSQAIDDDDSQKEQKDGVVGDDGTVRVDDEIMKKVSYERDQLARKLSDLEILRKRMETKHELLNRVRLLQNQIDSTSDEEEKLRDEESLAEENYRMAVLKRNATMDERDSIARERERIEKLLGELKNEKHSFEAEYAKMEEGRKKANARERELREEQEKLVNQLEHVVRKFYHNGFHMWLRHNLHALPPVVRETILKTSDALSPVVEGVEEVSEMNNHLTHQTASTLTYLIPTIQRSPFYTGLLFYVFLLCPTVSSIWLFMRVRARLSLLTVEHYLITISLYFGVMSTVCALMSIFGGADILVIFRHRTKHLAEAFMLIHGFLFVTHLVLHGVTAYVSASRKDFMQYIIMSCIGLHFFSHAYKRTILNRDPNIGAPAYIVYAIVFLYILYDRGIHIIEAVVRGRKAGLSAFGTFPADYGVKLKPSLPTTGDAKKEDTTVYFAGLPVFNGPSQSALNDAKTI